MGVALVCEMPIATVSPATTEKGFAVVLLETVTLSVVTEIDVDIVVATPFLNIVSVTVFAAAAAVMVPLTYMALKVQAAGMLVAWLA